MELLIKLENDSKLFSTNLQKLMGCVNYTAEEVEADPKLSYLINK